ncbi:hypothetical protein [Laceyella putida]|uniref:CbiN domain protein n=1 Tax=Laceyella putida TaxID=110101 RepID=A0ABW2RJF6_9BACL
MHKRFVWLCAMFVWGASLLAFPGHTVACSCIEPLPPQKALADSAAVFTGKVIEVKGKSIGMEDLSVRVAVDTVWKGQKRQEIWIKTPPQEGMCRFDFQPDQEYLIYAKSNQGGLYTNLCFRTKRLADAGGDLQALGKGTKVAHPEKAKSPGPLTQAERRSDGFLWSAGGIAVGFALLFFLWYRLKRNGKSD